MTDPINPLAFGTYVPEVTMLSPKDTEMYKAYMEHRASQLREELEKLAAQMVADDMVNKWRVVRKYSGIKLWQHKETDTFMIEGYFHNSTVLNGIQELYKFVVDDAGLVVKIFDNKTIPEDSYFSNRQVFNVMVGCDIEDIMEEPSIATCGTAY